MHGSIEIKEPKNDPVVFNSHYKKHLSLNQSTFCKGTFFFYTQKEKEKEKGGNKRALILHTKSYFQE